MTSRKQSNVDKNNDAKQKVGKTTTPATCRHCNRVCKSAGGLKKHLHTCKLKPATENGKSSAVSSNSGSTSTVTTTSAATSSSSQQTSSRGRKRAR